MEEARNVDAHFVVLVSRVESQSLHFILVAHTQRRLHWGSLDQGGVLKKHYHHYHFDKGDSRHTLVSPVAETGALCGVSFLIVGFELRITLYPLTNDKSAHTSMVGCVHVVVTVCHILQK